VRIADFGEAGRVDECCQREPVHGYVLSVVVGPHHGTVRGDEEIVENAHCTAVLVVPFGCERRAVLGDALYGLLVEGFAREIELHFRAFRALRREIDRDLHRIGGGELPVGAESHIASSDNCLQTGHMGDPAPCVPAGRFSRFHPEYVQLVRIPQRVEDLGARIVRTGGGSRLHRRIGIRIPDRRIPVSRVDDIYPAVEVATEAYKACLSCFHLCADGDGDVGQGGPSVELGGVERIRDHLESLHPVPCTRLNNPVRGVHGEVARPGVNPVVAVHHDVVPVALDGDIGVASGEVDIPLGMDRLDRRYPRTETHLQSVYSSPAFPRRRSAPVGLVEQILKCDVGLFKTHGIYVGYIVADDVEKGLVPSRARNSRHKGSKHVNSSLLLRFNRSAAPAASAVRPLRRQNRALHRKTLLRYGNDLFERNIPIRCIQYYFSLFEAYVSHLRKRGQPLFVGVFYNAADIPDGRRLIHGNHLFDGLVHVRHLFKRAELRHLGDEILVLQRIHRILVAELRDQYLQKGILSKIVARILQTLRYRRSA